MLTATIALGTKLQDPTQSIKTNIQSMNLKSYTTAWTNVVWRKETIKELAPHSREEHQIKCR